MSGIRSYSLAQLVDATGFDRRTIVYYIQAGLVPKVGRRGPHTRYPEECLHRLQFIRGVKDLQSKGRLLTATLAEIRRALDGLEAEAVRTLLERGLPEAEVEGLIAAPQPAPPPADPDPQPAATVVPAAEHGSLAPAIAAPAPASPVQASADRRSYGLADAGIRQRYGLERPVAPAGSTDQNRAPPSAAPASGPMDTGPAGDAELGALLRELEIRPALNAQRSPPGSPEQWTEIPITGRVYLSVRGLAAGDTPLAEAVARHLRRALRTRPAPA